MEDIDSTIALKEKLLIAGIDEIIAHGVSGFSLRRVAAACGASCAAPYKHFKNKEEFILEIISYVNDRWTLLARQIIDSIDDEKQRIAELCTANVRFKIANPLYGLGKKNYDEIIYNEISNFCEKNCLQDADLRQLGITILVAGVSSLIESGKLDNSQDTFTFFRKKIIAELD